MSLRPRFRTRLSAASTTTKALAGLGVVVAAVVAFPAVAGAQEADPVATLGQQLNLLWIVLGAILVIFMQAGFALVETGFSRAKHASHVVSTNFAIFGLGFVAFFLVGYAFMFGGFSYVLPGYDFGYTSAIGEPFIKAGDWVFLWKGGFALDGWQEAGGAAVLGYFLYMVAFMDTVATIPTGSMAERWQWKNFVLWGFFCGDSSGRAPRRRGVSSPFEHELPECFTGDEDTPAEADHRKVPARDELVGERPGQTQ